MHSSSCEVTQTCRLVLKLKYLWPFAFASAAQAFSVVIPATATFLVACLHLHLRQSCFLVTKSPSSQIGGQAALLHVLVSAGFCSLLHLLILSVEHLTSRVWIPSPQSTEHADHVPVTHSCTTTLSGVDGDSTGQLSTIQT